MHAPGEWRATLVVVCAIALRSGVVPIGDAIEAAIEANRALIQANRLGV
jgi:hypothetical protein